MDGQTEEQSHDHRIPTSKRDPNNSYSVFHESSNSLHSTTLEVVSNLGPPHGLLLPVLGKARQSTLQ